MHSTASMGASETGQPDGSTPEVGDVAAARPQIRVWPAVVLLTLFWGYTIGNAWIGMPMLNRFLSRMIVLLVMLLVFLGWWLFNRRIAWKDRLLAIAVLIVCSLITVQVADKSIGMFGVVLSGFPVAFTVWVMWIIASARSSPSVQRIGFCLITAIAVGWMALVRFEGLNGLQQSELSWRWTPTSEQQFLAWHTVKKPDVEVDGLRSAQPWTPQPGDWLEFRGPDRKSVVSGLKIEGDWKTKPPKLLWRQRVGPAWSSMIIVDGHLVTQEQRGQVESIVCYDATTGKEIWAHDTKVRFEEQLSGAGPRATPTFADGRIFAMGAKGTLTCLDPANGKPLWSRDIAEESKAAVPQWGYADSPLVLGDKVIVYGGGESKKSLLVCSAAKGDLIWTSAPGKQTYSSPQLVTVDGQRQLVMLDDRAAWGISLENGDVLWSRPGKGEFGIPMVQPQSVSASELLVPTEPGVSLIKLKNSAGKWSNDKVWYTGRLRPGFNDFVVHQGYIYGLDDGILSCSDLKTGERLWKEGRYGHGQLLLIADQPAILVLSDTGEVVLVAANPKAHEELGRFSAITGKTWNHPVVAHGHLYVRNGEEMAAFELVPAAQK